MYSRYICVSANERIAELSKEKGELTKILAEFAEDCELDGRKAVTIGRKNGAKWFIAGSYCGFAALADGTLVEILPHDEGGETEARKKLCAELCRRCGYTFRPSELEPDMNSMEYFIGELFVSSEHEMKKEHYISFAAYVADSTVMMFKQYPEWELQFTMPLFRSGRLVWYCTEHGLFYQELRRSAEK